MKRILNYFIILAYLVCSLTVGVTANDEQSNYIFDLKGLGILEDGYELEKELTRADAAIYITRLLGYSSLAEGMSSEKFEDVGINHPAGGEIRLLTDLGYISGVSETRFEPNGYLTSEQAATLLVRVLGYEPMANDFGGWPNGYTTAANRAGLYKGVEITDNNRVTLKMFAQMMYNALDVSIMEPDFANPGSFEINQNQTLRGFLIRNDVGSLKYAQGFLSATFETYILKPIENISENEVYIDGILYEMGDTNATAYLGMNVDFAYLYEEASGKRILKQIRCSKSVNYADVDLHDITDFETDRFYYESENGETVARIDASAVYVENFEPLLSGSMESFKSGNGIARLIDNDGNNVYELVIFEKHISLPIEKTNISGRNASFIFQTGHTYKGGQSLNFDMENPDVSIKIYDANGKSITPYDVKTDDVVSVIANSGSRIKIFVSGNHITGMFEGKYEDFIVIDGTEYLVENEYTSVDGALLGRSIKAYMSYRGRVVFAKKYTENENSYAVILGIMKQKLGGVKVRLALAGSLKSELEETNEDADADEKTEIPQLAARNSDVISLDCADKVIIDGNGYTDDAIVNRLKTESAIEYRLNEDGKLAEIEYLSPIVDGVMKYYDAYEMTFGKTDGGAFGINTETLGLCIPTNQISNEIDYLGKVKMNNGVRYKIQAFDRDEETRCAKLITVWEVLNYSTSGEVNPNSTPAIVTATNSVLSENGNIADNISVATSAGAVDYVISDNSNFVNTLETLKKGDFILYNKDTEELIAKHRLLANLNDLDTPFLKGEATGYETCYGKVSDIEYKYVSMALNKWVDKVSVTTGSGIKGYEVRITAPPAEFIYYKNSGRVEKATNYDITPGDEIFVFASYSKVKALVILR